MKKPSTDKLPAYSLTIWNLRQLQNSFDINNFPNIYFWIARFSKGCNLYFGASLRLLIIEKTKLCNLNLV